MKARRTSAREMKGGGRRAGRREPQKEKRWAEVGGKHECVVVIESDISQACEVSLLLLPSVPMSFLFFFFFTFVFLLFKSSQFPCCFPEMDEILYSGTSRY